MFLKFSKFDEISLLDFEKVTDDFIGEKKATQLLVKYTKTHGDKKDRFGKKSKLWSFKNPEKPELQIVHEFLHDYIYCHKTEDEALLEEYEQKILRTLLKSSQIVKDVTVEELTAAIEQLDNVYFKSLFGFLFLDQKITKKELEKLRTEKPAEKKPEPVTTIKPEPIVKQSLEEKQIKELGSQMEKLQEENEQLKAKLNESISQQKEMKKRFFSYASVSDDVKVKDFPDLTEEGLTALLDETKANSSKKNYSEVKRLLKKAYVLSGYLEDDK